jgi:hypothetical protein
MKMTHPPYKPGQGRTPADAAQQPVVAGSEIAADLWRGWMLLIRKLNRIAKKGTV